MSEYKKYEETELRMFDVDAAALRTKLLALGATAITNGEVLMKRAVFDTVPASPSRWIRLRTDGTATTLAFKERVTGNPDTEVELEVSDFEDALKFMALSGGFKPRSVQESKREAFIHEGVEVSLDSWPKLNQLMEIEAESYERIEHITELLGIDINDLTDRGIEEEYLDRLGIDVRNTDMRF